MESYIKQLEIRWSDLDANFHIRHSAFYDFGAYARITFLTDQGLTMAIMQEHHIGPVLFREECSFRKEIRLGDKATMNVELLRSTPEFSRWSIQHQFFKNDQLAAILTVDGAWINTQLRKLGSLPEQYRDAFDRMPKAQNFEWIVK
jgi:acyl-CoA thioester hydrolase